jgi:hypothetical protein
MLDRLARKKESGRRWRKHCQKSNAVKGYFFFLDAAFFPAGFFTGFGEGFGA